MLIQYFYHFTGRNSLIIAVQGIQIDIIRLQTRQTVIQIGFDRSLVYTWSILVVMRALRQNHDLVAIAPLLHIAADNFLAFAAAVNMRRIDRISAYCKKSI
ncbi:hypothetical protein D3C78_978340 [compost metagenome]